MVRSVKIKLAGAVTETALVTVALCRGMVRLSLLIRDRRNGCHGHNVDGRRSSSRYVRRRVWLRVRNRDHACALANAAHWRSGARQLALYKYATSLQVTAGRSSWEVWALRTLVRAGWRLTKSTRDCSGNRFTLPWCGSRRISRLDSLAAQRVAARKSTGIDPWQFKNVRVA